ncbi:LPXTG cell wall anchor domain-containing protein [Streptomyces sp. Tue6028]|uniref:LPXTG cell wall anchor domain-containing protein n=1 Tax=Streptomyces sp. Tue6028 TaxID=2036037 RepID=UPI003D71DA39
MRLRSLLPFTLTAAAPAALGSLAPAAFASTPAPALTASEPRPACAAPDTRDFPIKTRIHGGPAAYDVGGDFSTWYIDLTNTTAQTCGGIHPIVVLVDEKRALRPEQARLEFYEGEKSHAVTFDKSDEAENVGAFDDGFPGFTVAAGRTLTVKVRLSLTSDAPVPNEVVANAAVVQRHNDDGDWVGESNDYRFRVEDHGEDPQENEERGEESTGEEPQEEQQGEGRDPEQGVGDGESAGADPGVGSTASAGDGTATGDASREATGTEENANPSADVLASTGPGAPHAVGVAAGLLLSAAGAALFVVFRRERPGRHR